MADKQTSDFFISDKAIKSEKTKLTKIFKKYFSEVDENGKNKLTDKGCLIEKVIEEAAFLKCVLLEAKKIIQKDGIETTTINASQKFRKAVPAVVIYKDYVSEYTKTIDRLINHIPDKTERKKSRFEALMLGE